MNFPQFLKNKRFYIILLVVLISSLFFLASASSVFAFAETLADKSAAGCGKNQEEFSFSSFFNPLVSLAEKVVKDFGYQISLAAAPDPDFCGSDSIGCSGSTPVAAVTWEAAPSVYFEFNISHPLIYYILTIGGVGSYNTGGVASYTIPSGLTYNTTYSWSVEAYFSGSGCPQACSSASFGFTNQPHGSFTTSNCGCPPPAPSGLSHSCTPNGPSCGGPAGSYCCTVSWSPTPNAGVYALRVDDAQTPGLDIIIDVFPTSYPFWAYAGHDFNWWVHAACAPGSPLGPASGENFSLPLYCSASCGDWSVCSVSCGGGTQGRTCTRADCSTYSESQSCNTQACPPGNFSLSLGGSVACNSVPLTWTSSSGATGYRILRGASRVDISPYQPYTAQNFIDTTVSQNTTYPYQIEAYNSGGTNRSNTINVSTSYCPPTLNLSAAPTSIYQGQSTTLSWATTYTTSCTASGGWSGSKSLNGSQVVVPLPPPSVTYNLQCSGPGGSVSGSTIINIAPLFLPDWQEIIPR